MLQRFYIHSPLCISASTNQTSEGYLPLRLMYNSYCICHLLYQRAKCNPNRPLGSVRPFGLEILCEECKTFGKNLPQSGSCAVESWGTETARSYIHMNWILGASGFDYDRKSILQSSLGQRGSSHSNIHLLDALFCKRSTRTPPPACVGAKAERHGLTLAQHLLMIPLLPSASQQ